MCYITHDYLPARPVRLTRQAKLKVDEKQFGKKVKSMNQLKRIPPLIDV